MGKAKRPTLTTGYSGPRAGSRDVVSFDGRCQVADGAVEAIAILDLDRSGCRVRGITVAATKVDALQVWLGPVGPITAKLRWAKRGAAGLKFDQPLCEGDLERASVASAAPSVQSNVVALRRLASD